MSIIDILQVNQECYANGRPKGKVHYHLPTFDKDVDTRCFPLGYNLSKVECGLEPDPSVFCDSPVCHVTSLQEIQVLACFHSFHVACLSADGCCKLCDGPLRKIAKDLSDSFNKGLLMNGMGEEEENLITNDNNTGDLEISSTDEAEEYYTSPEWERKISEQIDTFSNITHPSKPNRQTHIRPSAQSTHHSTPNNQSRLSDTDETHHNNQTSLLPTLNLFVPAAMHQMFTTWHFPKPLSQSTIGGRNGSNGCTFIALSVAKLFYTFPPNSISPMQPLNQTLVHHTVSGMLMGNVYDSINNGVPQMYGVRQALSHLNFMGSVSAGIELPVSISKEQVPSASLPYHLNLASQQPKTACFLILCDKTVVFIPLAPNHVLLVDSHDHGMSGAFVALCDLRHIYELLDWFKSINRFQYTLGTVTQVAFP